LSRIPAVFVVELFVVEEVLRVGVVAVAAGTLPRRKRTRLSASVERSVMCSTSIAK